MKIFGKTAVEEASESIKSAIREELKKMAETGQAPASKPEVITHRHSYAFYPGVYGMAKITAVKGGYEALKDCLPMKMMACQDCGDIKFIALAVFEAVQAMQIKRAQEELAAQKAGANA